MASVGDPSLQSNSQLFYDDLYCFFKLFCQFVSRIRQRNAQIEDSVMRPAILIIELAADRFNSQLVCFSKFPNANLFHRSPPTLWPFSPDSSKNQSLRLQRVLRTSRHLAFVSSPSVLLDARRRLAGTPVCLILIGTEGREEGGSY